MFNLIFVAWSRRCFVRLHFIYPVALTGKEWKS